MLLRASEKTGNRLNTLNTMSARIEATGLVNFQEKVYKVPLGRWTKNPNLKEAAFRQEVLRRGNKGLFYVCKFPKDCSRTNCI